MNLTNKEVHELKRLSDDLNEAVKELHTFLVEVIQFLDANGHSNTKLRDKVDSYLNASYD